MKSLLFAKREIVTSKEFEKDVLATLRLPPLALKQLPECALRHLAAPTRGEAEQISSQAAEDLHVPKTQFDRAIDLARFFLKVFAPDGEAESDTPSSLADDVREALSLDPKQTEALNRLLGELKPIAAEDVQLLLLQRDHAETALPLLEAISAVADLRAVFDQAYKYEDDIDAYSPKFMGTIPVGIVEIHLKGAHTDEVFFQVTPRTLQILLDHLTALQRQMNIAEKALRQGSA